jgi:hypothetical protein
MHNSKMLSAAIVTGPGASGGSYSGPEPASAPVPS